MISFLFLFFIVDIITDVPFPPLCPIHDFWFLKLSSVIPYFAMYNAHIFEGKISMHIIHEDY